MSCRNSIFEKVKIEQLNIKLNTIETQTEIFKTINTFAVFLNMLANALSMEFL